MLPGATYFLDIGFDRERVAGEIDGRKYHCEPDVFESDRERQNALVLNGWLILRFTWLMLTQDPDYVVLTTRQALAARGTASRLRHTQADLRRRPLGAGDSVEVELRSTQRSAARHLEGHQLGLAGGGVGPRAGEAEHGESRGGVLGVQAGPGIARLGAGAETLRQPG